MDWDGIGTFALFLSSGAIGVGLIALRAYKARLVAKLEMARLERSNETSDEALVMIRDLEDQVQRLTERVEFNEKLIAGPGIYICDACVGLCNQILNGEPTPTFPGFEATPTDALLEALVPSSRAVDQVRDVLQLSLIHI